MTEKLHAVRIATREEEDEIMQVCRELYGENGLFTMDENKVRAMLHRAFTRQGGIIGVIGEPGEIEALTYIMISQFWYSEESHLEELFAYVRPPFRRSMRAQSLLAFTKRCSDELGIPLIIGLVTNHRTQAKARLYRRHLKDPVGAFFLYNGRWKGDPEARAWWKDVWSESGRAHDAERVPETVN